MSKYQTILVTGSTDGLGKRIVEKLAAPYVHILVHGRNADRGREVVDLIERAGGSANFFEADLSSLTGVHRLAEAVLADHKHLDVLVNNAGVGAVGPRRESADGFELHFAVNYLAHVLLTRLLRSLLGVDAPSRVVNVSSASQYPIDFSDVMLKHSYEGYRAYSQSKLAQVMHTFDLAEEFNGTDVTANCLHPATLMDTAMVRKAGVSPIDSVDIGADAVVTLAVSQALTSVNGHYFERKREARANAQAYDLEARRKLRAISSQLTGERDD